MSRVQTQYKRSAWTRQEKKKKGPRSFFFLFLLPVLSPASSAPPARLGPHPPYLGFSDGGGGGGAAALPPLRPAASAPAFTWTEGASPAGALPWACAGSAFVPAPEADGRPGRATGAFARGSGGPVGRFLRLTALRRSCRGDGGRGRRTKAVSGKAVVSSSVAASAALRLSAPQVSGACAPTRDQRSARKKAAPWRRFNRGRKGVEDVSSDKVGLGATWRLRQSGWPFALGRYLQQIKGIGCMRRADERARATLVLAFLGRRFHSFSFFLATFFLFCGPQRPSQDRFLLSQRVGGR